MKLATLCYLKHNGKTLMLHRNARSDDIHLGKWNGLGGKFEPGESPEQCVTREVLEETGLTIEQPKLMGILTFPRFAAEEDWYVFVFQARTFSGTLRRCNEGSLEWIPDEELTALPLWEGDRYFLEWMSKGRFFSGVFTYAAGRLASHSVTFHDTL